MSKAAECRKVCKGRISDDREDWREGKCSSCPSFAPAIKLCTDNIKREDAQPERKPTRGCLYPISKGQRVDTRNTDPDQTEVNPVFLLMSSVIKAKEAFSRALRRNEGAPDQG